MKSLIALFLALGSVWRGDCQADNVWGGAVSLTSDYLVRGISRSNDHAALQLDLHLSTDSGLVTGIFASNTQIDPQQPRDVELDAFLGFVWSATADWRETVRTTYYSYPWNQHGSTYDYAELDVDFMYRDALEFGLIYSPDARRYVSNRGFIGSASSSAEVNLERPIYAKLSGIAGVGYSHLGGPAARGYEYASWGAAYDTRRVAFTVSYVDMSKNARSLYQQNSSSHWDASIICRF